MTPNIEYTLIDLYPFWLNRNTDRIGDVADPWYTGDFEATWRDVLEGCQCLLEQLIGKQ